jgi:glutamate-5-semialdehyde dehydrogenase
MHVSDIARKSRQAALKLARLTGPVKDRALDAMADALDAGLSAILEANARDMEAAVKEDLAGPLMARLALNENKLRGMAEGIRSVGRLPES